MLHGCSLRLAGGLLHRLNHPVATPCMRRCQKCRSPKQPAQRARPGQRGEQTVGWSRFDAIVAAWILMLVPSCMEANRSGVQTGAWEVQIQLDGEPTVARISVADRMGNDFWPPNERRNFDAHGQSFFYASSFQLPAEMGGAWITVRKGPEVEGISQVLSQQPTPTILRLERRIDMVARGYRSGDGHVHPEYSAFGPNPPPPLVAPDPIDDEVVIWQMRGEDLGLANSLAANRRVAYVWMRDRVTGFDSPASLSDHILRYSEEYRSRIYGHMSVFGVSRVSDPVFTSFPFTPYPFDYPLNHDASLSYLARGEFASCSHLSAPPNECPVDIILGSISAIEAIGFAVIPAFALDLWERLLSLGYDVVLTAGTDTVLSAFGFTYIGGTRSYVDLEGLPFTYENWSQQLERGRGFSTNGAMLLLTVDGYEPGDRIALDPGEIRTMTVSVEVLSLFPFDTVTIRSNRRSLMVFRSDPTNPVRQVFTAALELSGPGWIYARLVGPYSTDMPPGLIVSSPLHEAATNAIYLDTGERRYDSESADFFAAWIEAALDELDARDNYGPIHQRSYVRSIFKEALDLLDAPR